MKKIKKCDTGKNRAMYSLRLKCCDLRHVNNNKRTHKHPAEEIRRRNVKEYYFSEKLKNKP